MFLCCQTASAVNIALANCSDFCGEVEAVLMFLIINSFTLLLQIECLDQQQLPGMFMMLQLSML